MEICSLCKASVSSGQEKKRRKKLHGAACKGAREALNAELEDAFSLHVEDFEDTSAANSFLCKSCDGQLNSILDLQSHLSQLKSEAVVYSQDEYLTWDQRSQPQCEVNEVGRRRKGLVANTNIPEDELVIEYMVSKGLIIEYMVSKGLST